MRSSFPHCKQKSSVPIGCRSGLTLNPPIRAQPTLSSAVSAEQEDSVAANKSKIQQKVGNKILEKRYNTVNTGESDLKIKVTNYKEEPNHQSDSVRAPGGLSDVCG